MKIVECVDVNKTYRQGQVTVQALKDINIHINKNEVSKLAILFIVKLSITFPQ